MNFPVPILPKPVKVIVGIIRALPVVQKVAVAGAVAAGGTAIYFGAKSIKEHIAKRRQT